MAIQDYLADIDSYTGGAKAEMDSANQAYADTAGAGSTLAGKLKEALNTKLNNNADLIEQKNSAMADYFAAPANARAQYQDIWNPFEREKLVANARTQAYKPYATFSDLLTNRMGQVSDIVGEGVQGWQYVIQQAQALAAAAAQKYQNLVGEYMNAAGLQNQADEMAWAKEQYGKDMAWDKEKFAKEMSMRGGSGGSGIPGVSKGSQLTAETWAEIMEQAKGDPDAAWRLIARDKGAMAAAGVDVQQLWNWQRDWKNQTTPAPQPTKPSAVSTWYTNTAQPTVNSWLSSLGNLQIGGKPISEYLNR